MPVDEDLSLRSPGHLVRIRASEEWAASKQRSRFLAYAGRAMDAKTEERAWRRGAEGEELVGHQLSRLTKKGWRVLHSVPIGSRGSDIDHLAIGPGGVFVINSKNHAGCRVSVGAKGIWVNGAWKPYVRNSVYEAERTTHRLSDECGFPVFAGGIVVVLFANFSRTAHPSPIHVLTRNELYRWLRRRQQVLSSDVVDTIFQRARWASTWTDA